MASYTIHLPPASTSSVPDVERFRLVRDGLSVWAMILWPFWFLAKRLWLGALGVYAIWVILNVGLYLLGVQPALAALSWGLFLLLIGLEAHSIERWTLARRGWTEVGVTVAGNAGEAEERAVTALAGENHAAPPAAVRRAQPAAPAQAVPVRPAESQVLGLFPEGRR